MKRKPRGQHTSDGEPAQDSPVAPEILESAKRSVSGDAPVPALSALNRLKPAPRCVVCNGEATRMAGEQLCWVCRRLKISAWREADQQTPAQE